MVSYGIYIAVEIYESTYVHTHIYVSPTSWDLVASLMLYVNMDLNMHNDCWLCKTGLMFLNKKIFVSLD